MTLDVIVVAFHSGRVLEDAVAAVTAFAPHSRLIVVDNSPDDPSAAAVVAALPGALLVPQKKNVGFAAAVNAGLAASDGEAILLLNPDVTSIVGRLHEVERVFAEHPRAAAVTVHLVDAANRLQHCRRRVRRFDLFLPAFGSRWLPRRWTRRLGHVMLEWDHEDERVVEQATGALLFLRRAAVRDVGPFDEDFFFYWEETEWLDRARKRGWRLVFTPTIRAVHQGQRSSERTVGYPLLLLEATYVYAAKTFGVGTAGTLRVVWLVADGLRLIAGFGRSADYRRGVRERLRVHCLRARPSVALRH